MKSHAATGMTKLLMMGGVLFGLSCLAGYVDILPAPRVSVNWDIPNGDTHGRYVPGFRVKSGPELAFIYIGSSSCGASNLDGLPEMIEALKLNVRQQADVHGRTFVAIGIAQDLSAQRAALSRCFVSCSSMRNEPRC